MSESFQFVGLIRFDLSEKIGECVYPMLPNLSAVRGVRVSVETFRTKYTVHFLVE